METEALPDDAVADVAYLARSRNRLRILEALAGGPDAVSALEARTGVSRSTLERILTELEERGWAERSAEGYTATAVGERVVGEFVPLVRSMDAIRSLGEAVGWIPAAELSVGLHHFADATVWRARPNDPVAGAGRLLALLREASSFENLTALAPPMALLRCLRDRAVAGELTATNVVTGDLVAYLRDRPDRTPYWREYLEAGARVYRYDGSIPCNLFVVDETVLITHNQPESGRPCEFVETTDEAVRSWATDLVESYREDARRLTAEAFTDEAPPSVSRTS